MYDVSIHRFRKYTKCHRPSLIRHLSNEGSKFSSLQDHLKWVNKAPQTESYRARPFRYFNLSCPPFVGQHTELHKTGSETIHIKDHVNCGGQVNRTSNKSSGLSWSCQQRTKLTNMQSNVGVVPLSHSNPTASEPFPSVICRNETSLCVPDHPFSK